MRAPFPYFGGKRRVADVVWRAFGDCPNYVEPFFGSGAVMLARPHEPKIETANDADAYVCNFWRAVTAAPDEVARWADWPVSEIDLHARHKWLISRTEFRERLRADPEYFDAKVAGWWVWGICQWIGSGWCVDPNNRLPFLSVGATETETAGRGVINAQARTLLNEDRKRGRRGHMPSLGNDRGLNGLSAPPCSDWFRALQARLRRVRFACGDFTRVLGPSVLGKGKNVGGRKPCAVFLDPPYSHEFREPFLYTEDDKAVAEKAREWAVEHGDDPELRICLAGYWDEHRLLMPESWASHRWKGARGYAGDDNDNREQETLWFSPHCLPVEMQRGLFDVA